MHNIRIHITSIVSELELLMMSQVLNDCVVAQSIKLDSMARTD